MALRRLLKFEEWQARVMSLRTKNMFRRRGAVVEGIGTVRVSVGCSERHPWHVI